MFDDLYLLSEGKCLYSGPISDMTAVFKEAGFECPQYYNRADFGNYTHFTQVHHKVAELSRVQITFSILTFDDLA